jgi:hypothetical protein
MLLAVLGSCEEMSAGKRMHATVESLEHVGVGGRRLSPRVIVLVVVTS